MGQGQEQVDVNLHAPLPAVILLAGFHTTGDATILSPDYGTRFHNGETGFYPNSVKIVKRLSLTIWPPENILGPGSLRGPLSLSRGKDCR
jgi:hypothetical protein